MLVKIFFSLFLIPTLEVKAWPNKATVFTEDCLNQGAIGVCYDKNTRDYYYTDYGIRTIAGNCSKTRPDLMLSLIHISEPTRP